MNKLFKIFIFALIVSPLTSQSLEDRYLNQANQKYLAQEYSEAYSLIKFVLNLNEGKELSNPAKVLSEKIFYNFTGELIENKDTSFLVEIQSALSSHPVIASQRVKTEVQTLFEIQLAQEQAAREKEEAVKREKEEQARLAEINRALEVERAAQSRLEEIRAAERAEFEEKAKVYQEQLTRLREEETDRHEKQQTLLREEISRIQDQELERSRQMQEDRAAYEQKMVALMESRDAAALEQQEKMQDILNQTLTTGNSGVTKTSFYIVILLAVIGVSFFLGIGALIFLFIKKAHDDQIRFENTLHAMHASRPITSINNQYALPEVTASMEQLKLADQKSQGALPAPDNEAEKMKILLQKCREQGEQIDMVTQRKNNSKNIAELVFKISKELGYDEKESILHFAIALVYDIGFLGIDPEILNREQVSEEEFGIIQNHVNIGLNMIHFVDREHRHHFREGLLKHHENLDGSGYPSGLKEPEIPYIARVLHIVDSFISLISVRNYRQIMDKESAVRSLQEETGKYDDTILEALYAII